MANLPHRHLCGAEADRLPALLPAGASVSPPPLLASSPLPLITVCQAMNPAAFIPPSTFQSLSSTRLRRHVLVAPTPRTSPFPPAQRRARPPPPPPLMATTATSPPLAAVASSDTALAAVATATAAATPATTRVLLLVGVPGSGKTTFASRLVAGGGWVRVSQDDLGGNRPAVERRFKAALESGEGVVVDRCNCSVQQRRWFIETARAAGASVGTVLFASPVSTCISRVNQRTDHPTLPPSASVAGVVRAFAADFEPPTAKEGVSFGRVVRTDDDVSRVLGEIF